MSVGNISPYIFGEFACTKLEKADDIQKTVLGGYWGKVYNLSCFI